jgi:hypothetical protein
VRRSALLLLLAAVVGFAASVLPAGQARAGEDVRAAKARRPQQLKVVRITPRTGAKFVDLAAEVSIVFNRPVDPTSVDARTVVLRPLLSSQASAWTVRFELSGRRAVIAPSQPFAPGADYEVVVGRGVRSADGMYLRRERRAIFFTDPRFGAFSLLDADQFEDLEDRMSEGRAAHSATLVAGGRVLLAGGMSDQYGLAAGADVYDPDTKGFRLAGSLLRRPRAYHQAVGVGAGSAMLLGGWDGSGATATTEFYDRIIGDLVPGPTMTEDRDFHAAVVLQDGRILVTGGGRYDTTGAIIRSSTAEILDFDFRWRPTKGAPLRRRIGHTLTVLPDGSVLVAGGQSPYAGLAAVAEIFDPKTETFRFAANPPRDFRSLHSAAPIDGGTRVLLADGGDPILEVYDPASERFFAAGGASFVRRSRATATTLPWGDVILAGGFQSSATETIILSSIDLYVRDAGDWGKVFHTDVVFKEPRAGHTAISLQDGRVLFAGGFTNDASLDSAVLFTPRAPDATK